MAFGTTELPERQAETLRKAIRYEWITIGFLASPSPWSGLVAGTRRR